MPPNDPPAGGDKRTARKRSTATRTPAKPKDKPATPRRTAAGPAQRRTGASARETPPRRATPTSPSAADAGWRSGLGTLLRGSGGVLGQLSGIDGPARSLERLARAAENAGAILDRVDAEIGIERLAEVIDNIERLTVAAEELRDLSRDMRRSIREVEERVVDLHMRVVPALDRLPLTRRRPKGGDAPDA